MLRTSVGGDSIWMRTFGGSGTETAGNIEVTSDGGFVVIGTTSSYGAGQNDILLLRTDSQAEYLMARAIVRQFSGYMQRKQCYAYSGFRLYIPVEQWSHYPKHHC